MINPYWGANFFQFFAIFFERLFTGFSGKLMADEVQAFVLMSIALSSSLVGTFLVWRRMTMLANALSHTILAGIVFAYLSYYALHQSGDLFDFGHLLPSDSYLLVSGIVMALLTTFLTQTACFLFGISEDSSVGMVFTFLFAIGIVLVTLLSKNAHVGVELLMGNVDALSLSDLKLASTISLSTLLFVLLLWRPLFLTSFDPLFAKVGGISLTLFGYLLMTVVAIVAVSAFRAVGVLLFLAFLVTPPLIARLWTDHYKKVLIYSCLISVATSLVGVALSRALLSSFSLALSTGALIVSLLFIAYSITILFKLYQRSGKMLS